MGKAKKRTLYKSNRANRADRSYFMTREDAVNDIFKLFYKNTKKEHSYKTAVNMISLFGITAEELSERGVPYENLQALSTILT